MTFNQLAVLYPDVKYEVNHGVKRIARVTVEYVIEGSPETITRFLEQLDREWPFSQQRCKTKPPDKTMATEFTELKIEVEYLVKKDEIEQFVKSVPYRGERITLVS